MVVLRKKQNVNESKQVGKLYHVCTLEAFVEYIIPKNTLSASGNYTNHLLGTNQQVSFTRDQSFVLPSDVINNAPLIFQIEIDGDTLSNNHKIMPYNDLHDWDNSKYSFIKKDKPRNREMEECVMGPIKDFKSYINKVRFDIKSMSIFSGDTTALIEDLEKVKDYLGSIPCVREVLPTRYNGPNGTVVLSKKKKNQILSIKNLDDLINVLSDSGKDVEGLIDTPEVFLDYLTTKGADEDILISILKKNPSYMNISLERGNLVDYCIYYRHFKVLKYLFQQGLDKPARSGFVKGYFDCVEEGKNLLYVENLLSNGMPPDVRSWNGDTLLHRACKYNNFTAVKFLIKYGADVNAKDNSKHTPLYAALHPNWGRPDPEIVQYLKDHGAKE